MKIELKKEFRACLEKQQNLASGSIGFQAICECGAMFWKHPNTRTALCCVCRSSARLNYTRKRYGTGAEPIPGYTQRDQFQTIEEIKNYLSGTKVECLLCGRTFKALNTHLKRVHEISLKSYRDTFGIRYKDGLIGTEFKQNLAKTGAIVAERVKLWELAPVKPSQGDQIHGSVALLNQRKNIIKKANDSANHLSRRLVKIPWVCAKCGDPIEAAEMAVITNGCRLKCRSCRLERIREWHKQHRKPKPLDPDSTSEQSLR